MTKHVGSFVVKKGLFGSKVYYYWNDNEYEVEKQDIMKIVRESALNTKISYCYWGQIRGHSVYIYPKRIEVGCQSIYLETLLDVLRELI